MGGMGSDTGEDISQPRLRIDVIHLCADDKTVHGRCTMSAAIGAAEEPRFSSQGYSSQPSLGGIVGQAHTPILEE